MDILTLRGQETVRQENLAIKIWEKNVPDFKYVHTPKDRPCTVDAFLVKNNIIQAVVETKCRDMYLGKLKTKYSWRWLVTFEKIVMAQNIARQLHVPLVGFLYCIPDKTLLVHTIWNPKTGYCDFEVMKTKTQATVNGGDATRDNAYINVKEAKVYE